MHLIRNGNGMVYWGSVLGGGGGGGSSSLLHYFVWVRELPPLKYLVVTVCLTFLSRFQTVDGIILY